MKKANNKLTLSRETLLPLQTTDLDGIHGGATPAASVAASIAVSRVACNGIVSAASAIATAIYTKKG